MLFKKLFCDHVWLSLGTEIEKTNICFGMTEVIEKEHIYCPKCDKRKKVSVNEAKRLERIKEIKEEWDLL